MKRVFASVVFSIAISVVISLLVAYLPKLLSRADADTEQEVLE
jgi:hypothetical protein